MNNICVLIPSYNEARTIGNIVKEVKAQGLSVYVVDDGSSDGTAAIASGAGAVVIKHEKNMGKGTSLREGFKHILKDKFEAVIIMDGDNQHEAGSIPDFVRCMREEGADMVIGNRMLDTKAMPYLRFSTNRFMSYLLSRICGQRIPDTQCGYRLIKAEVLRAVPLTTDKYEIESELLIGASKAGFKIKSIPIKSIYGGEKSQIHPFVDTLRFLSFIIKTALKK